MPTVRTVTKVHRSEPTEEGAGVRLKRAIGGGEPAEFDPFLLLDDMHSDDPEDYVAGFPWHPHRGIETVTYVISGLVEHGDSLGNRGAIASGDVQWMTAGSGIVHQEMPQRCEGTFRGLQLWVNLPRASKMMTPRYRGIAAKDIHPCRLPDGTEVRVIAGRFHDRQGPAADLVLKPEYLDVTLPAGVGFSHLIPARATVFAYVLGGEGSFGPGGGTPATADDLVSLGPGDAVAARAGTADLRFLLVSGEPLREPIAWRGPIVMNTEAELDVAFRELRDGTFIKGH